MGRNKLAENAHPSVTLRTLSAELGVSPATVMRALQDQPCVRAELRRKIIRLAQKRNYFLPGQPPRLVAVVIPGFQFCGYTGLLLSPLMEELFSKGFHPEIVSDCELDILKDHVYAGVISLVWNAGLEKQWPVEHTIPLVVLNAKSNPTGGIWQVSSDEAGGISMGLEHLWQKGRRRIAFVSTALGSNLSSRLRVQTFYDFCSSRGGMDFSFHVEYSPDKNLKELTDGIFARKADAVFAACETYGHQFLSLILQAGYKVPGEMALLGLEDRLISPYTVPAMSTLAQNFELLARKAVAQLLKQADSAESSGEILVPYRLIERQTT